MKPKAEHVKPLEDFDDKAFAGWLRRGFEDLNNDERRVTAFAPLNYFVGYEDDLTRELKNIYDYLSGTAQENFRKGIATALSDLPPMFGSVPTARELLHLAGRVHATELLPIAVQQFGNGFFGLPDHEAGRELFALTLDIVSGMSPASSVADTVKRLANSSFFQREYAPMAFIALCRAEPDEFPNNLRLLRNYLAALSKEGGTDFAYFTSHRFVHYVDLAVIARKFWRLRLSVDPGVDSSATDAWFADALFFGKTPPLRLYKTKKGFFIVRRDREETQEPLAIRWPKNKNHWSQVLDVMDFLDRRSSANRDEMWRFWNQDVEERLASEVLSGDTAQEDLGELFVEHSPLFRRPASVC